MLWKMRQYGSILALVITPFVPMRRAGIIALPGSTGCQPVGLGSLPGLGNFIRLPETPREACYPQGWRQLQAGSLCSPDPRPALRHNDCWLSSVQNANEMRSQPENASNPDIFFRCEHCNESLVVNRAAAGMTLNCQRCGTPTAVPNPTRPTVDAVAQSEEVQRCLKENESQRTEVTSYINQLSIQLHRWQLRLKMLNERKQELEEELRKTS